MCSAHDPSYCGLSDQIQDEEDTDNDIIIEEPVIRRTFRRRPRNHGNLKYSHIEEWRMHYHCGLSSEHFDWIMLRLKPRKNIYERYMDKEDQLVLTLLKFKQNYAYRILALIYHVPKSIVKSIFAFWTAKLYKFFKRLNAIMEADLGPNSDFKSYSSIITCVELKTREVVHPAINRILYSSLEQANTFKYLVAVSECGEVTYCSDLFGGSVSHIEVFKRSGYLEKYLQPGDVVLASFDDGLRQILRDQNIKLHTTLNGDQLAIDEVIMKHRQKMLIWPQRVLKRHKILRDEIRIANWPIIRKVVFVAHMLHNHKNSRRIGRRERRLFGGASN